MEKKALGTKLLVRLPLKPQQDLTEVKTREKDMEHPTPPQVLQVIESKVVPLLRRRKHPVPRILLQNSPLRLRVEGLYRVRIVLPRLLPPPE